MSNGDTSEELLFRKECTDPIKEPNQDLPKVQILDQDMIAELKTNVQPPSELQDAVLVYPIHETPCNDLSRILTEHEIQSLIDIQDAKNHLRGEFGITNIPRKVFVSAILGDIGLHELKDSDEFIVIDSNVFLSKKEERAKLENDISNSLVRCLKLHSFKLHINQLIVLSHHQ